VNFKPAQLEISLEVVPLRRPEIAWDRPGDIVYGTLLSARELNARVAGFELDGHLEYSPGEGSLLNAGADQELSVTFVPDRPWECESMSVSVQLTVRKAVPNVEYNVPSCVFYGDVVEEWASLVLDSVPTGGTFVYSPPLGSALVASGDVTIKIDFAALPPFDQNYMEESSTFIVMVLQRAPSILWETPADIYDGTWLSHEQLNAVCSLGSDSCSLVYSPPFGHSLPEGQHTLSVTCTPIGSHEKSHKSISAEVTIRVLPRAVPLIEWPVPEPIVYGTRCALSRRYKYVRNHYSCSY